MSTAHIYVTVRILGPLKTEAGTQEVSLALPGDTNVAGVAAFLADKLGRSSAKLVEAGEFRGEIRVLVNGRDVHTGDRRSRLLQDGDRVSLLLPISGGSSPR